MRRSAVWRSGIVVILLVFLFTVVYDSNVVPPPSTGSSGGALLPQESAARDAESVLAACANTTRGAASLASASAELCKNTNSARIERENKLPTVFLPFDPLTVPDGEVRARKPLSVVFIAVGSSSQMVHAGCPAVLCAALVQAAHATARVTLLTDNRECESCAHVSGARFELLAKKEIDDAFAVFAKGNPSRADRDELARFPLLLGYMQRTGLDAALLLDTRTLLYTRPEDLRADFDSPDVGMCLPYPSSSPGIDLFSRRGLEDFVAWLSEYADVAQKAGAPVFLPLTANRARVTYALHGLDPETRECFALGPLPTGTCSFQDPPFPVASSRNPKYAVENLCDWHIGGRAAALFSLRSSAGPAVALTPDKSSVQILWISNRPYARFVEDTYPKPLAAINFADIILHRVNAKQDNWIGEWVWNYVRPRAVREKDCERALHTFCRCDSAACSDCACMWRKSCPSVTW